MYMGINTCGDIGAGHYPLIRAINVNFIQKILNQNSCSDSIKEVNVGISSEIQIIECSKIFGMINGYA
jgi:hypothetical protein